MGKLTEAVERGDWVARDRNTAFEIARVRQAYEENGGFFADLVPYDFDGRKIGRQSPACGGPRSFEPWCSLEGWRRIEPPDFPLERELVQEPAGEGRITLTLSVFHDGPGGVRTKPPRTRSKRQSGDRPRTFPWERLRDDELRRALQQIADGHNDPMTLARKVLGR